MDKTTSADRSVETVEWGLALWDQDRAIDARIDKSCDVITKVRKFISGFASLQGTFAKETRKLVKTTLQDICLVDSTLTTEGLCWTTMFTAVESVMEYHAGVVDRLTKASDDMKDIVRECEQSRKLVFTDLTTLQNELSASRKKMDNSKRQYEKSVKDLADARTKLSKSLKETKQKVDKARVDRDRLIEETKQLGKDYINYTDSFNNLQRNYYSVSLRQSLNYLQNVEETRIITCTNIAKQFAEEFKASIPVLKEQTVKMLTSVAEVSPKKDSATFAKSVQTNNPWPVDVVARDLGAFMQDDLAHLPIETRRGAIVEKLNQLESEKISLTQLWNQCKNAVDDPPEPKTGGELTKADLDDCERQLRLLSTTVNKLNLQLALIDGKPAPEAVDYLKDLYPVKSSSQFRDRSKVESKQQPTSSNASSDGRTNEGTAAVATASSPARRMESKEITDDDWDNLSDDETIKGNTLPEATAVLLPLSSSQQQSKPPQAGRVQDVERQFSANSADEESSPTTSKKKPPPPPVRTISIQNVIASPPRKVNSPDPVATNNNTNNGSSAARVDAISAFKPSSTAVKVPATVAVARTQQYVATTTISSVIEPASGFASSPSPGPTTVKIEQQQQRTEPVVIPVAKKEEEISKSWDDTFKQLKSDIATSVTTTDKAAEPVAAKAEETKIKLPKNVKYAVVMFNFAGHNPGELHVSANQRVAILNDDDSGWVHCSDNDFAGYLPKSYLRFE